MLIPIDITKQPEKIKLSLAKPNKTIIANLPEAMHISYDNLLGRVNELSFVLPYEIEKEHELIKNPHTEMLRERYLIKLKWGNYTEWFIINQISDEMDDKDVKRVHAFSLSYELKDRLIRNYSVTSYTPSQVLNDALSDTIWSVGEISTEFQNKYRSFEVSEKSVLDFVFEIGETYGGIIDFDTENRLVHLRSQNEFGEDKGFRISYGKYLKSLKRESDPDEMVTRLKVYGKDGLSINAVNPTGTDYIESFSYFMYPFQRDENRNVIQSSYYMSDELCHALLDYEELVESKRGVYENLLNQKKTLQETLTQKNNELDNLKTELAIIQDKLDLQKSDGDFTLHDFTFNGGTVIKTAIFDPTKKYVSMIKVSNNNGIQFQLDLKGQETEPIPQANTWIVRQKYANQLTGAIWLTGTGENIHVTIYFVAISDEDYEAQNNDEDILSKYNDDYKQAQINAKQAEINDILNQIQSIDTQIQNLKNELAIENNFTPELIQERNQYIIERVWTDENYIDAKELYDDAIKKFEELKSPKMQFNIDIVNFMEILEEQRNWNKLSIGDTITIKYEKFNVNIKAMVTEIHYNDGNLSLTITNIQNLNNEDNLLKMLYSSYSTSTSVDMSKYKWNNASNEVKNINNILNNDWDAAQRRIIAGANESVEVSRRGIIIKNPNFPDEMLIAQAGVLALSKDGGKTWQTAITPDGVVAERLIGKILSGQNLIIENESGKYTLDANGLTIDGGSLFITNGLPESQIDPNAVNKWNNAEQNAKNYVDQQLQNYVDTVTHNQDISNLQNQIDGNITSWFYPYDPTLTNEPAINWTTDNEKNKHLGDIFYNTSNGYAYRFAYENGQYKWILLKDSDIQKALADAAKAQDTADQKRRVFVSQPTPPYDVGDLWANGQSVYRCKTAKVSGQTYSSSDWELVGDVTSLNTANNTANVGNQPATTVATAVSNFNARNDRKSTPPANPIVATDGSAIDHTINTDGSADISFEWSFNGTGDAYDIDGFIVYVYQSTNSSPYSFGTSTSEEQVFYVAPDKRSLILYGVPADKYYTFGVQAYRIVDQDIDNNGILKSSIVKSTASGENPYRPSSNIAFSGDITGTINGINAATVVTKAMGSLQEGALYNSVKIDANSGLVATRNDNKSRVVVNATDGIKIQKSSDNGNTWNNQFYVDTNGTINATGLVIDGTSTIAGSSASAVASNAMNALQQGIAYNNVKIDSSNGLVATKSDNKTRVILNATDGIKVQKSTDGVNWTDVFYVDTDGDVKFAGKLEGASGTFSGTLSVLYSDAVYDSKTQIDSNIYNEGKVKGYDYTNYVLVQNGVLYVGSIQTSTGNQLNRIDIRPDQIVLNGSPSVFLSNFYGSLDVNGGLIVEGNITVNGSVFVESYQDASLINGWTNYGGSYQTVQFMKDKFGFVHIRGSLKGTTNNITAFILPAGYRPSKDLWFTVSAGVKQVANVAIHPDGRVAIDTQALSYVSLDDIPPFKAEQ
jgi:phage minor structural protein